MSLWLTPPILYALHLNSCSHHIVLTLLCYLFTRFLKRSSPQKKACEYKFYTEFQSHEPEFDYLKSLEIEEKINKIRWCKRQNQAHFLLSTNGPYFCHPLPPTLLNLPHPANPHWAVPYARTHCVFTTR